MRRIVDYDVRIHTMLLDQPFTIREHANLRRRRNTTIRQRIRRAQPDLTAPRPHTINLTQTQTTEPFRERLAVTARILVDDRSHRTVERELHVRIRLTNPRLE